MRKYVNGKYLDMTTEEAEEIKRNLPPIKEVKETLEERLNKLENSFSKLLLLLDKLGVEFND